MMLLANKDMPLTAEQLWSSLPALHQANIPPVRCSIYAIDVPKSVYKPKSKPPQASALKARNKVPSVILDLLNDL